MLLSTEHHIQCAIKYGMISFGKILKAPINYNIGVPYRNNIVIRIQDYRKEKNGQVQRVGWYVKYSKHWLNRTFSL